TSAPRPRSAPPRSATTASPRRHGRWAGWRTLGCPAHLPASDASIWLNVVMLEERPSHDSDAIRLSLNRVLKSGPFADSERLRRLLTFAVEESLAGRADGLTEYALALEVFERSPSFDPKTDSIVRVY